MIADDNGVQSLGGVIGGEPTGCTEATTEVFIEAALFDPVRTAATGRRLEIISDARYRFERGLDPEFIVPGLEIATRLILELCGGEPSEIVVAGAEPEWRRTIHAAPDRIADARRPRTSPPEESRADPRSARLRGRGAGDGASKSRRRRGAATSRARPISSRRCCASTATTRSRPCRSPRDTVSAAPGDRRRRSAAPSFVRRTPRRARPDRGGDVFVHARRRRPNCSAAAPRAAPRQPDRADLDADAALDPAEPARRRRGATPTAASPDVALFEIGPQYRDDTPEGQANAAAGMRAGRIGPRDWREPARRPTFTGARPTRSRRSPPPARRPTTSRSAPIRQPGTIPAAPARCGSGRPCSAISASCIRGCSSVRRRRARSRRSRSSSTPSRCRAPAARAPPLRRRCSSRSSAISPSSSTASAAGRDAAARRARRRPQARRRHPPLRRLRRQGPSRRQEIAGDHGDPPAARRDPDRRRDRSLLAAPRRRGRKGDRRSIAWLS